MGFRITTWNVNGIRNPFSYEPWRGKRTFEAMFDALEADIVVFQETKIQRKDLRDDMVLIPGWDCYFSLPRIKKGYSGVVIYTRNATCAPIRAEEGLTGVLCPPNSSVSYRDLSDEQRIGGYPTVGQLSKFEIDAATLDSEGRCVVLEFPAFVLIGVYCPANRDESRDCFRLNFIDALDARIRNLASMGRRVFVTGDLNISRGEIDSAHAAEAIRKGQTTENDFVSAPARRVFNQLLVDGKIVGKRDEGRERPALYDICRSFHPDRRGMYTCWEQRINARPGNYGARIDYVLCSPDMQGWFSESNIQEGLLGSDHCPVYAVFNDCIPLGQGTVKIHDIMNPPGMFENGERQQEYTTKYLLPPSGRLIPEFDKRRSIKDMFTRKPLWKSASSVSERSSQDRETSARKDAAIALINPAQTLGSQQTAKGISRKRPEESDAPFIPVKRSKSAAQAPACAAAGQQTLKGFFKPKNLGTESPKQCSSKTAESAIPTSPEQPAESPSKATTLEPTPAHPPGSEGQNISNKSNKPIVPVSPETEAVVDPLASKEDWSKLFSKKPAPKCESHEEPCVSLTTKKPGINCGRAFWICPRPLGPSGSKEKGTQWRCTTFIWASDWNAK